MEAVAYQTKLKISPFSIPNIPLKAFKPPKTMRVASLFSGCGGLDLGFTGGFTFRKFTFPELPYKIVFSNDFDKDAVKVYNANKQYFKDHSITHADIRGINEAEVPRFDILLAGFPCQPFSNAGNREGLKDRHGRGTLFYECVRILSGCKKATDNAMPMAFVFENVRGILSTTMPDGTSVPDEIVKQMKKLGYNTSYQLINASEFGVPQNRYRVIMIGIREDLPPFNFNLFDEILYENRLPSSKVNKYELTLGSILSDIPNNAPNRHDLWNYSPSGQKMIELIGPCLDGKEALAKFKKGLTLDKISHTISSGKSWKNINPSEMTPRFKKIYDNPVKYHAPNFYRRFALGEICGTITASGQPENSGITHTYENRRFSVREIARIQSFPDDFEFPHDSISSAYKVIGNAVPPILGWVIGKALREHLERIDYELNT